MDPTNPTVTVIWIKVEEQKECANDENEQWWCTSNKRFMKDYGNCPGKATFPSLAECQAACEAMSGCERIGYGRAGTSHCQASDKCWCLFEPNCSAGYKYHSSYNIWEADSRGGLDEDDHLRIGVCLASQVGTNSQNIMKMDQRYSTEYVSVKSFNDVITSMSETINAIEGRLKRAEDTLRDVNAENSELKAEIESLKKN